MEREIVICKVDGLTKNRPSACPDYTCTNCPKIKKTIAPAKPKTRTFQFTQQERKIFAEGGFDLSLKIYLFLKDFIERYDEEKIRAMQFAYKDFKEHMQLFSLHLRKFDDRYLQEIFNLSFLINKYSKQRKNIPIECFLYSLKKRTLTPERIKDIQDRLKDIEESLASCLKMRDKELQNELQNELQEVQKALHGRIRTTDFKELSSLLNYTPQTLKVKIARIVKSKHIAEIYNAVFSIL